MIFWVSNRTIIPNLLQILIKNLTDVSNEEKFEKLVSEEKLKTPFKRRLSSNSTELKMENSDSENENERAQVKKQKIGR